MAAAEMGMNWKETLKNLTDEFMAWGCPFSRRQLPEIAMGYDCTPLFFWNWLDDPETPRTEKGFLRVLGYAWQRYLQEEADSGVKPVKAGAARIVKASGGKAA